MVAFALPPPRPDSRTLSIASLPMVVIFLGIGLVVLSREEKDTPTAAPAPPSRPSRPSVVIPFHGVQEAWRATAITLGAPITFLRLVGVWAALLWALPYGGIRIPLLIDGTISAFFEPPTGKVAPETQALVELLLLPAVFFVVPTALVAWHRYILADRMPRARLPGPDNGKRLYRLLFGASLLVFFFTWLLAKSNASDVAHLLGIANRENVLLAIYAIALVAFLYIVSAFALVFPAAAEGKLDFLPLDSVRATKPLGNSYRTGFLLSLLPFGALTAVAMLLLGRAGMTGWQLSFAQYSLLLVPVVGCFLILANCATYVTLVYRMQMGEQAIVRSVSE